MHIIITALIALSASSVANAKCSKNEVCEMENKMNLFAILDKCPMAGQLIAECKNSTQLVVRDLPEHQFIEFKDGTIADTKNYLLGLQTEIPKKNNFYDAERFAKAYSFGNHKNWCLPSLPELKSLMSIKRLRTKSGKRSYLLPPSDDGVEWNQYWTTTDCNSVNLIIDKYGKKYC